jgi:hypothetical protein
LAAHAATLAEANWLASSSEMFFSDRTAWALAPAVAIRGKGECRNFEDVAHWVFHLINWFVERLV